MRIFLFLFGFLPAFIGAAELIPGYLYSRTDRLWVSYSSAEENCYASNLCLRQGEDAILNRILVGVLEQCIDVGGCIGYDKVCANFNDKQVSLIKNLLPGNIPNNYEEINSLASSDDKKKYYSYYKIAKTACLEQAEIVITQRNNQAVFEVVDSNLYLCGAAQAEFYSGDTAWKKTWINYYNKIKASYGNEYVVSELKSKHQDCVIGGSDSEFQKESSLVSQEYEKEQFIKRKILAEEQEFELAKKVLSTKKDFILKESFNKKISAEKEKINALARSLGLVGFNANDDITSLLYNLISGVDKNLKLRMLVKPSHRDSFRVIQVVDDKVIYNACENCPTISIFGDINKTYVNGQVFDLNYYYEYLGSFNYNSVSGGTYTSLLFKPHKI